MTKNTSTTAVETKGSPTGEKNDSGSPVHPAPKKSPSVASYIPSLEDLGLPPGCDLFKDFWDVANMTDESLTADRVYANDCAFEKHYQRRKIVRAWLTAKAEDPFLTQESFALKHSLTPATFCRILQRVKLKGELEGTTDHRHFSSGPTFRIQFLPALYVLSYHALKPKVSIRNLKRLLKKQQSNFSWRIPSEWQIRNFLKSIPQAIRDEWSMRADTYHEKWGLVTKRTEPAYCDVWYMDEYNPQVEIERIDGTTFTPWLIAFIDGHTRVIPHILILDRSPTAADVIQAFKLAMKTKSSGRSAPFHGVPRQLRCDGARIHSTQFIRAGETLGIDMHKNGPELPEGNGKVERFHKTLEQMLVEELPGFTKDRYKNMGSSGRRLSLREFQELINKFLSDYHFVHQHSGLKEDMGMSMTPGQAYLAAFERGDRGLDKGNAEIDAAMLVEDTRTFQGKPVKLAQGRNYLPEDIQSDYTFRVSETLKFYYPPEGPGSRVRVCDAKGEFLGHFGCIEDKPALHALMVTRSFSEPEKFRKIQRGLQVMSDSFPPQAQTLPRGGERERKKRQKKGSTEQSNVPAAAKLKIPAPNDVKANRTH